MIPLWTYYVIGYALIALSIVILVTAPAEMKAFGVILAPAGVVVVIVAKTSRRPRLRRGRTRQT